MSEARHCPSCGAELAVDSPMGLCVPCLLGPVVNPDPARFGDYELLDAGKEGGMGKVYRARQISLDRIVALKMIRGGELATPAQVQRFRAEAHAAASLDHPNIVPIYEVGEHDGRDYFAMKWLAGGSLADALRAQAAGKRAMELRDAAQFMARVARAVHHAHQRGIIHRDLKPSNILLDAHGEPQVSDFGLAKRLDSHGALTLSDQALGTPSYMAPEQAAGKARDVTTAADIYSLGALLYELLTRQPPFAAETPAATMQKVINEEPKRPSSVIPKLPRDLETICLKCLEKDPPLRYPSAEAVAQDLERWLHGEPLLARPSSLWGRTQKWARRNPAAAALAAALTICFLVGAVVAIWQSHQNRLMRLQALESAARYVSLVVDPAPGQGDPAASAEALQAAISFLERLTRLRGSDSTALRQQGLGYLALSKLLTNPSGAISNACLAQSIFAALAQQNARSATPRNDLARADLNLGGLLIRNNRLADAQTYLRAALDIWQGLSAESPRDHTYKRLMADTCNRLADLFRRQNRPDLALEALRQGISAREGLVAEFPTEWLGQVNLAVDYENLAAALAMGPASDATNAQSMIEAGTLPLTNDPERRVAAEDAYGKAIALFERQLAERPTHEQARSHLAATYRSLGGFLAALDRPDEAIAAYQNAISQNQRLASMFPPGSGYLERAANVRSKVEALRPTTQGK